AAGDRGDPQSRSPRRLRSCAGGGLRADRRRRRTGVRARVLPESDRVNTFGLYHPGHSVLHRLPAGAKLLAVAALILALTLWIRQPWQVLPALALAVLAYAAARIPPRLAVVQLRPLVWMLAIIAAFQVLVAGWERAVVICGSLLVAVALAALVTLTTRTTEMLDAIVRAARPLARVGVDPDRVGLVLV